MELVLEVRHIAASLNCETNPYSVAILTEAADLLEEALKALGRIERWEMPETVLFWPNEDGSDSDRPMSYSAAYGSNGERDFVRSIARAILTKSQGEKIDG